jgi:lysophospholipase L1-like esterase
MSRRSQCQLVPLVLAVMLAAPTTAAGSQSGIPVERPKRYYVALGDSLAVGTQPIGAPPFFETEEGYTDQLFARLVVQRPKLRLVKFGCGGESTVSMRHGSQAPAVAASCGPPDFYRHRYPHKTQLAEAVHFLRAHRNEVALVTIDIGGNDVAGPSGVGPMLANLPVILDELRTAAGPDVPVVGMTYYAPFLPVAWAEGGLPAVRADVAGATAFNDALEGVYEAAGDPVADVEQAFGTTDFTLDGGTPANVLLICRWTWMCAPPPLGPDIHPNAAGYGVIAQAFIDVLNL